MIDVIYCTEIKLEQRTRTFYIYNSCNIVSYMLDQTKLYTLILARKTKAVYIFRRLVIITRISHGTLLHYASAIAQGGINTTASDGILWETEIYI